MNTFVSKYWLPLLTLFICVTMRSVVGQTVCTETVRADIAFVVDGSGSICDIDTTWDRQEPICNNWRTVRRFLRDVVSSFTIGTNDVKFALVLFGNKGTLVFSLSGDRNFILNEIDNLNYPGGNTNTSGGIKIMRTQVFNTPEDRADAQNVAIILTDGKSTYDNTETVPQAELARAEDVMIYSIGVTNSIDINELQLISSPPQQIGENYFTSPDFTQLEDVRNALIQETCMTPSPPDNCGQVIADLTFVVDGSGSICDQDPDKLPNSCQNWQRVLTFMQGVVSRLTIGPQATRVAVITFANQATLKWNLNEYSDLASLTQALGEVAYPGGNTHTAAGLNMMLNQVYTRDEAQTGDRPDAADVVIVITDGKSTKNSTLTIPTAERAHQQNINVFAVGITDSINEDELSGISSPPQERDRNYFTTPDFERLDDVLEILLQAACITPAPVTGCNNAMDVVFIVDSSGSIGQNNFDKVKAWLSALISTLDVDSGSVRVGLVTFSTDVTIRFQLNTYNNREDIQEQITNLPYTRGTTNTAQALSRATDSMFNTAADRSNVPNLIVILTDGGSDDKGRTADEAIKTKSRGIHIMAVGMGGWLDKYELYTIATHPYQTNVILIPKYDDLSTISQRLKDSICNSTGPSNMVGTLVGGYRYEAPCCDLYLGNDDNECSNSPCRNGGQCVDMIGMYVCQCPSPYGGVNCEYSCREPADFSLALDSSGSIGRDNFLYMLDFGKRLMMELPLPGSRMAFETFATDPKIYFHLKDIEGRMNMLNSMTVPYYSGGTTNTAAALRDMRDIMFNVANGDQSNRPNVGLVVTDGKSNNQEDTFSQAMQNRDRGIEMLALGVGGKYRMEELVGIASWPTSENVFTVDEFSDLQDAVNKVRDAICNAVDDCSPNPCRNGGQCRDLRNGYHCMCQDGFTGRNCERGCSGELDLAIILDKSGSIQSERYPLVKQFLMDILEQLEMWEDKIRIAAITFHDDATLHFDLNDYAGRQQDAFQIIRRLPFGGGRTNMAAAFDIVRTRVFTESNGARQSAPDVVLLFTDGGSNVNAENTIPSAVETKVGGARVVTVAVGRNLNMMEIYGVSSLPSDANVFTTQSFNDLSDLVNSVVASTCNDVNECSPNPCDNGARCIDEYRMYSCLCTGDFTGQQCQTSCRRPLDVAFVLDFSGSVKEVYENIIRFTRRAVYGLDFKQDRARVGLITYDDSAEVKFNLNKYNELRDVLMALSFLSSGGRTNTQDALRLVREQIFVERNGDRNGVPNKLVVVTDGGSNVRSENTVVEANRLKSIGVEIFVVAVGPSVDLREIQSMASNNNNVYQVSSSQEAESRADQWLQNVCQL